MADRAAGAAGLCLKRVDLARRIRLLGVRAGSLMRGARNLQPAAALVAREPEPDADILPLFGDTDDSA